MPSKIPTESDPLFTSKVFQKIRAGRVLGRSQLRSTALRPIDKSNDHE